MPFVLQVSYFIRKYPGLYWNPLWPTKDKSIPYQLFYLLNRAIRHNNALERMSWAHAVTHGYATVKLGSDAAVKEMARLEEREAFGHDV